MPFVPVKTADQQAALMLVGVRDRLIRNCMQLSNAIRGYAAEFGITSAKGRAHLVPLLDRIQADESLPVLAREPFATQAKVNTQSQEQIDAVNAKLVAWHRADECSRRLGKIPGVRADRRSAAENEDAKSRAIPMRPPVRDLDRLDAEGSFDRRQSQARRYHPRRR
jgi:transposase